MLKRLLMIAALFLAAGCTKGIKDDIEDLEKRVSSLEDVTRALQTQLDAGALISSVTPLPDGSGHRIEFTGGSSRTPSSIDVLHGNHGVTPMIEVRTNSDGTKTVWYKTDGDWTDTGVDLTGDDGTGSQGPKGNDGLTPELAVYKNDDNVITLHYRFGGGDTVWIDTGVDLTGPAGDTKINSIVDLGNGTVSITLNDAEDYEDMTKFVFEKASPTFRFEIMTTSNVNIIQDMTGKIKFVVNPSTAWIPTNGDGDMTKWELNAVETRASYVDRSAHFSIVSIVPDENASGEILEGQYIATIECEAVDPLATEYVVALVFNGGSKDKPSLVSSSPFTLGATARTPQKYMVGSWADLQGAIDGALDRDIIDISGLTMFPDDDPSSTVTEIVTVSKDITITAQMDPVLGQFELGGGFNPFRNVHFVLDGDPTVTFEEIMLGRSADKIQPLISGTGNVIVKDSSFNNAFPIDIDGDVQVYGTIAELLGDIINHTSQINATQTDDDGVVPNPAIRARNVTVNGGGIGGGSSTGAADAGIAIEATGDVTITGEYVLFDGPDRYLESVAVTGGYAHTEGNGGDAIVAAGKVTINGSADVKGGYGAGPDVSGGNGIVADAVEITGEYKQLALTYHPSVRVWGGHVYAINNNGTGDGGDAIVTTGGIDVTGGAYIVGGDANGTGYFGGSGIIAGGDVTLTGTRVEPATDDWWFSLRVRSGCGEYQTGVPFKFSGDDDSPARTLTANTAQISDVNSITHGAPWAMELQANDSAVLDDCRLGWYDNIPLFSGGWYKITNPFNIWGTLDNGTELP